MCVCVCVCVYVVCVCVCVCVCVVCVCVCVCVCVWCVIECVYVYIGQQGKENSMSREDLLALLTKRSEQCKKMEGNISGKRSLCIQHTLVKGWICS